MTCRSCELLLERKWRGLDGVTRVDANAATGRVRLTLHGTPPDVAVLQGALGDHPYKVLGSADVASVLRATRPSLWRLAGLFALVWFLGAVLSKLGVFGPTMSLGAGTNLGTVFVIGLVAASSSCIAVSGGLLLSSAGAFNARYSSVTRAGRMRPVALFVLGRVLSYGLLGGFIGLLGKALTPSPFVTGLIAIIAAIYMLIMGLDMLNLAPQWSKRLLPRLSKTLSHQVLDAGRKEHWAAPFLLGAATFVLPCGFTQALQLYALTTGSFWTGAGVLLAFALGTAPALLALGWASTSLRGKVGRFFLQFSGAVVVVMGLWNIQNGFAVIGHPLSWSDFETPQTAPAGPMSSLSGVSFDGDVQTIDMAVGRDGYVPSRFTIRPGVLTRWQIDGTDASGCETVLQSPALGIAQRVLFAGRNVLEFTAPTRSGVYPFSCSMGMYRGQIVVASNS